jgi:prepilin-type N-terminal cleavage/methylation domain-containing protein
MRERQAFTLIELLIVVAIIAILAAIAVPNFLEAQVRSKVSAIRADLRAIKTAIEAYRVDNNDYPYLRGYDLANVGQHNRGGIHAVIDLTTPIAYMSSVDFPDPFAHTKERDVRGDSPTYVDWMEVPYSLGYVNIRLCREESNWSAIDSPAYVLLSLGPDRIRGPNPAGGEWGYGSYAGDPPLGSRRYEAWHYDPSNGTRSYGDILMFH